MKQTRMELFLVKIKDLRSKLFSTWTIVANDDLIDLVLNALPRSYLSFTFVIARTKISPMFKDLKAKLLQKEIILATLQTYEDDAKVFMVKASTKEDQREPKLLAHLGGNPNLEIAIDIKPQACHQERECQDIHVDEGTVEYKRKIATQKKDKGVATRVKSKNQTHIVKDKKIDSTKENSNNSSKEEGKSSEKVVNVIEAYLITMK